MIASLAIACAEVSCEANPRHGSASATNSRSEIVEATAAKPVAQAPAPPPTVPRPDVQPARRPRKLCDGQSSARSIRDLPRKQPSRATAPGEAPLANLGGNGRWIWVNLWAAWCEPCKQELSRIRKFAARLAQAGRPIELAFVSLDDDERQLEQYLRGEPVGGQRATYWLREGRERTEWLSETGVGTDPQLPVQLFVDPRGKIRCTALGAVEEEDYQEIAGLIGGG